MIISDVLKAVSGKTWKDLGKDICKFPFKRSSNEYSLNKSNPLGCGRLALAIVRQYVKDNPHLTYKEIQQRLPNCAVIGTWKEIEQESTARHDPRFMSRWFTRHEELMTSADKRVFALTNQWGANGPSPNILPMIEFARKQGYVVEEL